MKRTKISEDVIDKITERRKAGEKVRALCDEFGISDKSYYVRVQKQKKAEKKNKKLLKKMPSFVDVPAQAENNDRVVVFVTSRQNLKSLIGELW